MFDRQHPTDAAEYEVSREQQLQDPELLRLIQRLENQKLAAGLRRELERNWLMQQGCLHSRRTIKNTYRILGLAYILKLRGLYTGYSKPPLGPLRAH